MARKASAGAKDGTGLHLRVDFASGESFGPGKARLLELIAETGSISAAGRALGMSYRRAWLLIDALNHMFARPLVDARHGGGGGGGAALTEAGAEVLRLYREVEHRARAGAVAALQALAGHARKKQRS
jgi:molybdate transport system regulatory protein